MKKLTYLILLALMNPNSNKMKKFLLFAILIVPVFALSQIINIPHDYPTIQEGIDAASNGDTVLVQPGTYVENINYNGKNITLASLFLTTQDTSYIFQTIIDGNQNGSVVVFENEEDSTTVLCGFTITNGNNTKGGGIYCVDASPFISNVVISNNCNHWSYNGTGGGGIYCENSTLTLENVTVTNNSADFYYGMSDECGGGICCINSDISIQNSIINNNSAVSGGGIYCYNSSPVLQNVTISNNSAYPQFNPMWWAYFNSYGGGINCINGSNPVLQNVTIKDNSAQSGWSQYSSAYGGGIYCNGSSPDLQHVIITNNSVSSIFGGPDQEKFGGGIYCSANSYPKLEFVSITDNSATSGGGLYCSSSTPVFDSINRCNIFLNSANWGNDLYSDTLMEVIVDTFSVLYPTNFYAEPLGNYSFDILHGIIEQVDADLYISPDGDNANTGLTINDPLKNFSCAFSIIRADSLHQNTIHLLEGTYSPSTTEEVFPINVPDYISLVGESESGVILDAEEQSIVFLIDLSTETFITDLTITGGNENGITISNCNPDLQNLMVSNNAGNGIYCTNGASPFLTNIQITDNAKRGIVCESESNPILENLTIADNSGGGIYCDNSSPYLSDVTIINNSAESGGGLYCSSSAPVFDSINRCNIFLNSANWGNDLYSDTLMEVVVDTFSVLYPTNFYAEPLGNYSFDILHGIIEQVDADLYISPDGDNANTGLTVNDPLKNFSNAYSIIRADSLHQNTIHLLEGRYSPSTTEEVFPINVPDYISLVGESESGVILDAEEQSIVFMFDLSTETFIADLTITGGNGNGITISNCNPDLQNLMVSNNAGNGIYCTNGASPFLTNIQITGNAGWGIVCESESNPILENLTIADNYRGGLACSFSSPVLQDVTLSGNSAESGGGIYCDNSSPYLSDVTIVNNSATDGGGIYCSHSNPTLLNVIISNNSAPAGGGIYCDFSSPHFKNVIIKDNFSSDWGGGIYCHSFSNPVLINVHITGNTGEKAGAGIVSWNNCNPTLINATITNNSADEIAGAIYAHPSSNLSVVNSVLWNNLPHEISGSSINITYSDIQGGWDGEGNIDEDPLFIESGDHPFALSAASPCIDAGTPDTSGFYLPPWDIIGNERIWDGDGNDTAIIDMGAYEFGGIPVGTQEITMPGRNTFQVNNYPNPFSTSTTIAYKLHQPTTVQITIFNHLGKQIELIRQNQSAGKQQFIWNAEDLPSGMYFCVLKTDSGTKTMKMIKLK